MLDTRQKVRDPRTGRAHPEEAEGGTAGLALAAFGGGVLTAASIYSLRDPALASL
jgi:hypothetical protein